MTYTNMHSDDANASFADAMAGLRAKFVDSLVDRIEHMEELTLELSTSGDYAATLRGISAAAHRITGVAGTLGFGVLGASARQLEEAISEKLSRQDPYEAFVQVRPQLDALLESLQEIMDTAP